MSLIQKIRHSLILKHTLLLLLMLILVLGTGFSILYFLGQKLLNDSVNQKATLICRENVNRFDQTFFRCESITNMLAAALSEAPQEDWTDILDFTLKSMAASDEGNILAIGAATIPDDKGGKFTLIRHDPEPDTFRTMISTKYADESWFSDVVRDGAGKWHEPFRGQFTHELLAVYSRPFFHTMPDGTRKIIGVVCIDIGIQWLDRQISEMKLDYQGRAFLISDKMQILSLMYKEDIGKQISDLDYRKYTYGYDGVADEIEQMAVQKRPGGFVLEPKQNGSKARFFFQPMRSTGWLFGVLFPEDEIGSPMRFFRSGIIIMIAAVFIVIVCFVLLMTYWIYRSLKEIRHFAAEIGNGNFSVTAPAYRGWDERGTLITTIDRMRFSLMKYIENLKRVTEKNERIESELLVAQRIQYGLLPNIRPPFPGSDFFEASARLLSAKEIGGDLYDCAMIGPDKLCFVIGDVSGKGVPAALFMVFTQVIQRVLRHDRAFSPKMIASGMNDILLRNNRERLFVTFLCGFIDARSGTVTYCNAGHNPFFILKKDGSLDEPCQRNGIPIGLRTGISYTESECRIEPGDTIVLYTDGITEAEDHTGKFYGSAQFRSLLKGCAGKNLSADGLVREIVESVSKFSGTSGQSDDITCLAIQYKALPTSINVPM